MDFEADDGLVFRQDFWRDRHGLWSGFRHKEANIIASARGKPGFYTGIQTHSTAAAAGSRRIGTKRSATAKPPKNKVA